jgi:hypothetical protein
MSLANQWLRLQSEALRLVSRLGLTHALFMPSSMSLTLPSWLLSTKTLRNYYFRAVSQGKVKRVHQWLKVGMSPNATDPTVPMHIPFRKQFPDAQRNRDHYSTHGARPGTRNRMAGLGALHYAAWNHDRVMMELLLSCGADPNLKSDYSTSIDLRPPLGEWLYRCLTLNGSDRNAAIYTLEMLLRAGAKSHLVGHRWVEVLSQVPNLAELVAEVTVRLACEQLEHSTLPSQRLRAPGWHRL